MSQSVARADRHNATAGPAVSAASRRRRRDPTASFQVRSGRGWVRSRPAAPAARGSSSRWTSPAATARYLRASRAVDSAATWSDPASAGVGMAPSPGKLLGLATTMQGECYSAVSTASAVVVVVVCWPPRHSPPASVAVEPSAAVHRRSGVGRLSSADEYAAAAAMPTHIQLTVEFSKV